MQVKFYSPAYYKFKKALFKKEARPFKDRAVLYRWVSKYRDSKSLTQY